MSSTTHLGSSIVTLALVFCNSAVAGWTGLSTSGAAAAGRAFTSVSVLDVGGRSWLFNPALTGWRQTMVASLEHARWYGLPELTMDLVAVEMPRFPLGVAATRFGGKLYRETSIYLASAWQKRDLRVGVAVHADQTSIARYGQRRGLAVDVALLSRPSANLVVSAVGRNVLAVGGRTWAEGLDRSLAVCLAARLSTRTAVGAELLKDPLFPAEARVGLEFEPLPPLLLRAGVTVGPPRTTLGFRLNLSRVRFDYAFVHHTVLGGTHFVGMTLVLPQMRRPQRR